MGRIWRYIEVMDRIDIKMDPQALSRGAEWLSGAGLRPTRQRVLLAGILVGDGSDRHVTAEWLHDAAGRVGDKVSLATVYNTLRAFSDAGLVQEITVDGTGSYFDTRTEDHPHFYWEDSNTLTDASADELQIARLPSPPAGMEIAKVDVVIRLRRKAH
jgi:Fur family iron response transcriptional regulator